jgi:hypothetical protein
VRRSDGHGQPSFDVNAPQLELSPPSEAYGIEPAVVWRGSPTLLGTLLLIGDRLALESSCHGVTPVAREVYPF